MPCDHDLVQIVDAAMAEAVRKSGSWLACRPGCAECCIGAFPISMVDAERLRAGLAAIDPEIADRVRRRATDYIARLDAFPGDLATGVLSEGPDAEEMFAALAEDEPCPALDPEHGTCDLYAARPITCRIFGPAVRAGGGAVGVCELCYVGASAGQIAACTVDLDIEDGGGPQTLVAFALR